MVTSGSSARLCLRAVRLRRGDRRCDGGAGARPSQDQNRALRTERSGAMTAEGLDGNAAAGILFAAYGREMTSEIGSCTNCGNTGPLAEAITFLHAPGTVLRCRRCQSVL